MAVVHLDEQDQALTPHMISCPSGSWFIGRLQTGMGTGLVSIHLSGNGFKGVDEESLLQVQCDLACLLTASKVRHLRCVMFGKSENQQGLIPRCRGTKLLWGLLLFTHLPALAFSWNHFICSSGCADHSSGCLWITAAVVFFVFKLADPPSLRFSDSGASRALLSVAIGLLHANVLGDAADIGVPLFALPALGALLFVFGFVGIQSSILSILQHRQTRSRRRLRTPGSFKVLPNPFWTISSSYIQPCGTRGPPARDGQ